MCLPEWSSTQHPVGRQMFIGESFQTVNRPQTLTRLGHPVILRRAEKPDAAVGCNVRRPMCLIGVTAYTLGRLIRAAIRWEVRSRPDGGALLRPGFSARGGRFLWAWVMVLGSV